MLHADGNSPSLPGASRPPATQVSGPDAVRQQSTSQREALQTQQHFLSGMSHALKTPLNAILGFSELGQRAADDPALRAYFGTIREAGTQLFNLLNDLLDLARAREGEYIPSVQWLSWPAWLTAATEGARDEAAQWDIDLSIDAGEEVLQVESDPVILRRVLSRLLINAISYTPAGGSIRVRARLEPGEKAVDGTLVIRVEDSGTGIPESLQEQLFEGLLPGEQVESRGPSLGLALSRALLQTVGGNLILEASSERGSIFRITLPVRTGTHVAEPLAAPPRKETSVGLTVPNLNGRTILIADDQASNRDMIRAMLEGSGAHLLEAGNGQQILEITQHEQVDLCLVDIHMPVLDGFGAASALRQRSVRPVLAALSGHAVRPETNQELFDAWLTKPIDMQTLYACVEQLIGTATEHAAKHPRVSSDGAAPAAPRTPASGVQRDVLTHRLRTAAESVSTLRRNQSITLIEALGLEMQELGREAGCGELTDWGSRLALHASLFDMEPMNRLLDGFDDLVQSMEECHAD